MGNDKKHNAIEKEDYIRRSLSDYERRKTDNFVFEMAHAFVNSLFIDYPYQRELDHFRLFCVDAFASIGHLSRLGLVGGMTLIGVTLLALITEVGFVVAVVAASLLAATICLAALCSLLHNLASSVHACMHMRAFTIFDKTVALRNALCKAKVHLAMLTKPEYTTKYPAGLEYSVARELEEVVDDLLASYSLIELKSDSAQSVDLDERAVQCERWFCEVNKKILNQMLPNSSQSAINIPDSFVPEYSITGSPFLCMGFVLARGASIFNHLLCRLPEKMAAILLPSTHKRYRRAFMSQTNSLAFNEVVVTLVCDRYNYDPLSTIHALLACADKQYVFAANTTVHTVPAIFDAIRHNYCNEPVIVKSVDSIKISYWLNQGIDDAAFDELTKFIDGSKHTHTEDDVEKLASHLSAISSRYSAIVKQPKEIIRLVNPADSDRPQVVYGEAPLEMLSKSPKPSVSSSNQPNIPAEKNLKKTNKNMGFKK